MAAGKPAARATVQIGGDDKKLRAVLAGLRKRLGSFFASIKKAAAGAGKLIAAGIGAGLTASIALAVKFENIMTRMKGVFEGLSSDAAAFSKTLANRVGRSTAEIAESVTDIGARFRAMGLSASTAFELASRSAAAAFVVSERLGVNASDVESALEQASMGRTKKLQALGFRITGEEVRGEATKLGLDIANSADQIKMFAHIMERIEQQIAANTSTMGRSLDDGENASQRLGRIYAQIRDQLTELGQKFLPVFSNILAGISVLLGQLGDTFSAQGLGGVAALIVDAAKPFTNILVAGLHDILSWFVNALGAVAKDIGINIQNAINRTLYKGAVPDVVGLNLKAAVGIPEMTRTDAALAAAAEHLKSFGATSDAAAKLMREKFEAALKEIQAGAATLSERIGNELGTGAAAQAVSEAAGTFSARAAFSIEARYRNQEMRTQKAIESNTDELAKAAAVHTTILREVAANTRATALTGAVFA
jgi:hypothetical protein